MNYKSCSVRSCTSTTVKTPEKRFITVPKNAVLRKKWLLLASRDPLEIKDSSVIFFCQDHFNLKADMANYYQYEMGLSQRIIMKKGVMPSKFYCQEDRRKMRDDAGLVFDKRQRTEHVPVLSETGLSNIQSDLTRRQPDALAAHQVDLMTTGSQQTQNISSEHFLVSSYMSPVKMDGCEVESKFGETNVHRIGFIEDRSNSVVSPDATMHDFSFLASCVYDSDTDTPDSNEDIDKIQHLNHILRLIINKPMMYIGIPKEVDFIVQLIHNHTNIKYEHILMCLKKIRLNNSFCVLEDDFGLPLSCASELFLKYIPIIASVLQPLIVNLNKHKSIPIPCNYHNITCIINCLEINIEKPSNSLLQAQTWSDYRKSNTVKYLISSTPNGLINYVSAGFGGKASDVTILENCNFLDSLQRGHFVMAERGFKHIKAILDAKGIKLLRPPSASQSKLQAGETNITANRRINVEGVISRISKYHMLSQHSVIDKKILRVLNEVVVIACALINLQESPIIKI